MSDRSARLRYDLVSGLLSAYDPDPWCRSGDEVSTGSGNDWVSTLHAERDREDETRSRALRVLTSLAWKDFFMTKPIRILMQTTIPFAEDNWHIGRFSLLRDELSSMKDKAGNQLCEVTTRDREADAAGNDPVLSSLDKTDFDELWLFAI